MQVAWGGYLSDEDTWLRNFYLYKSTYHLHYSDCACYKSMSTLDEQLLPSSVSLLSHSPSPPLSPSGFMCTIMMSMTYGTTLSLYKYSLWILSTCYQYPCWLSFVTRHTNSFVTCSRVQLKCDGTRRTGGKVNRKLANGVGSQYSSHYLGTWCIQHYYHWCAHLGCQ